MLAEFALTPEIFDEQAHPDRDAWWQELRDLANGMFPHSTPCAMMVSDLFDGSWRHVAADIARAITDHRARPLCQGLLQKMAECLVPRPASPDGVWPEGEVAWANEAIASYTAEPIDRIITSATTCATLGGRCHAVRSLAEVTGAGFWHGAWVDTSPPMRIAPQINAIRKICVHAEFVCFVSPDIYGSSGDETDFVMELIHSCQRRPPGFRGVEIEIHTETFEPNPAHPDFADKLAKRVANVSRVIRDRLSKGQSVRLVIWPKLLDRLLIAGTIGAGPNDRRPRWGISMSHVARKPDEKRADFFTEWKLLSPSSLGRWFDQYCKGTTTKCLQEVDIKA